MPDVRRRGGIAADVVANGSMKQGGSRAERGFDMTDTAAGAGIVIVGGGLAGAKAAEAARAKGFAGPVTLIGAEAHLPYERPPLSKSYLMGKSPFVDAQVHDEQWYATNDVQLRLGTRAESLDLQARAVRLDDGSDVRYDQ